METTSEAVFIAGLLLRMHVFVPINSDPASFLPSDEAWYRFTNTSTRAGLKLTPAIANVVGGADTDDARNALYNRRGIWYARVRGAAVPTSLRVPLRLNTLGTQCALALRWNIE